MTDNMKIELSHKIVKDGMEIEYFLDFEDDIATCAYLLLWKAKNENEKIDKNKAEFINSQINALNALFKSIDNKMIEIKFTPKARKFLSKSCEDEDLEVFK